MKPRIKIDEALRARMAEMAVPYFGKRDCSALMSECAALISAANPRHLIVVVHIPHDPDLSVPRIRAMVVVDWEMHSGLIFTPPAPAAANDDAPPAALAA